MKASVTSDPSSVIHSDGTGFFFVADGIDVFKTTFHDIGSVRGFFADK